MHNVSSFWCAVCTEGALPSDGHSWDMHMYRVPLLITYFWELFSSAGCPVLVSYCHHKTMRSLPACIKRKIFFPLICAVIC